MPQPNVPGAAVQKPFGLFPPFLLLVRKGSSGESELEKDAGLVRESLPIDD